MYILIPDIEGSIVVCINPLTSLMIDQQAKYAPRGLQTDFVGEEQLDPAVKDRVLQGKVQLVYITPECIIDNNTYREMLLSPAYPEKLVALVIDKAHCVKTWGDEFRTAFSKIGSLRSLIPQKVHVMALTATAMTETYHVVTKRLSMHNTVLMALPPYRDNIMYEVRPKIDLDQLTTSLCDEINMKRIAFPKTVIYVRSYSDCSNIYLLLKKKLGPNFTEPPGYPNMTGFRLIDMFSRVLTQGKKDEVLQSFSKAGSLLRLIIATTTFGMGIDCPDIRKIIHWGIPSTMEEYVQETGRSGRDGGSSEAVLYKDKGGKHAITKVKNYVANTTECRRRMMFQDFLLYSAEKITVSECSCCDVCKQICVCDRCVCKELLFAIDT